MTVVNRLVVVNECDGEYTVYCLEWIAAFAVMLRGLQAALALAGCVCFSNVPGTV